MSPRTAEGEFLVETVFFTYDFTILEHIAELSTYGGHGYITAFGTNLKFDTIEEYVALAAEEVGLSAHDAAFKIVDTVVGISAIRVLIAPEGYVFEDGVVRVVAQSFTAAGIVIHSVFEGDVLDVCVVGTSFKRKGSNIVETLDGVGST